MLTAGRLAGLDAFSSLKMMGVSLCRRTCVEAFLLRVGSRSLGRVFERFTDRGRRVLVLAQEEARLLNHSFIGTEHVLLGLIQEGDGVAAQALQAVGVTLQAARLKVEETIGMSGSPPSGSPPFTPRAKKVLELAMRESLQMGHHHIGTEHLLLGIIREGEGVASSVLLSLGADLGQVRQKVIELISGRTEEELRFGGGPITSVFEVGNDQGLVPRHPQCPHCRADVAEDARYSTVDVLPGVEDEQSDPLQVVIVYCGRCDSTLSILPANPQRPNAT
jgi:ATP-dependent Clp protease ATP-binding subunit ClpA